MIRGGVEDIRLKAKGTKKTQAKAKDSPSEDRHSRGQGLVCSRPRTGMLEAKDHRHKRKCSPKNKVFKNFLRRSPKNKVFKIFFQANYKILTIQKILLSSSREQSNFRGLEVLRPRPRISKCVLENVPEAKVVLLDSTSDFYH